MASATPDLTDDYSCSYCLQRFPYMEDPRQLPCSHVFCLPCLDDDLAEHGEIVCRICFRTHEVKLDSLPAVSNSGASGDGGHEELFKVLCDICEGERAAAVVFCSHCKKNYCGQHHKLHDAYLGTGHDVQPIKPIASVPTTCDDHADEPLSLACSSCHLTFCSSCDTVSSCCSGPAYEDEDDLDSVLSNQSDGESDDDDDDDDDDPHTIVKVEELAGILRDKMKVELKNLSGTITEVCKEEKSVWKDLDEVETKVKNMTEELDAVVETKIKAIKDKSVAIKEDLEQYLEDSVDKTSSNANQLMYQKEELEVLWKSMRSATNQSDLHLIGRQKECMATLRKAVTTKPVTQGETRPKCSLMSSDTISMLQSPILHHSTSPTYLKSVSRKTGPFFSVLWNSGGNLLAGSTKLHLFTQKLQPMKSPEYHFHEFDYWPTNSSITAVVELVTCQKQITLSSPMYAAFVTNRDTEYYRGTFFSSQLVEAGQLYEYYRSNSAPPGSKTDGGIPFHQLDVNPVTHQIIAVDCLRHKFNIFSPDGNLMFTVDNSQTSTPNGPHCLADGTFLLSFKTGNLLRKCSIDSDTKKLNYIWVNKEVNKPTGISTDDAGFIYVGSQTDECIYILSPAGTLLKTLIHQWFRDICIWDVAVRGDSLAVACDKYLLVFNISRSACSPSAALTQ